MKFSDQINELMPALLKAQGELEGVAKDAVNPHFRSQYATLESVHKTIKGPFQNAGLIHIQDVTTEENRVVVETVIAHAASGQWVRSSLSMPTGKGTPQDIASASTYGRRYGLMPLAGLAPMDDDGESAQGRGRGSAPGKKSSAQAKRDGDWETLERGMKNCNTPDELRQWGIAHRDIISALPDKWQDMARDKYEALMGDLEMRHANGASE